MVMGESLSFATICCGRIQARKLFAAAYFRSFKIGAGRFGWARKMDWLSGTAAFGNRSRFQVCLPPTRFIRSLKTLKEISGSGRKAPAFNAFARVAANRSAEPTVFPATTFHL